MKRGWLGGLAALALVTMFAACEADRKDLLAPDSAGQSAQLQKVKEAAGGNYMLVAGSWGEAQDAAVEAAGGTVVYAHPKTGIGAVRSSNPAFLDNVLKGGTFSYGFADERIEWRAPVEYVEATEDVVTPGDEGFFPYQWNMQAIQAPGAWAAGYDGSGARVAVIDGGLYDVHADIAPNLDAGCSTSFVPGYAFNEENNTFWHGTHVAGIIAAADNGFGVIGVAPGATLLHVKALHDDDGDGQASGQFSWIIGAILFASDPGAFPGFESCQQADIINMSLGALFPKRDSRGFQSAITKAVNFAASKGILVVSSAGNSGVDLGQLRDFVTVPAQSGSGLAVSATGPEGFIYGATNFRRFASYSNWGEDLVTVAGPGGDYTLAFLGDANYVFDMVLSPCRGTSTPPTYSFCFAAGTSMSAPAVSGVAALIVGKYPGIPLGKLKSMLINAADDEGKVGKDEFYGHGFVNANRAVN